MSKDLNLKRIFQKDDYLLTEDWIKPTERIGWVSVLPSLSGLRSAYTYIDLEIKEELINIFDENRNYILNLSDNWDGYGAQPFNEGTLNRAYILIENILNHFLINQIDISIPLIQPVADGSIDINWETDEFELLINISSESNKQVNLYGEKLNSPEEEIEMHIPYDLVETVIIPWLKRIL